MCLKNAMRRGEVTAVASKMEAIESELGLALIDPSPSWKGWGHMTPARRLIRPRRVSFATRSDL